nr:ribonuclease H-like domain, reverse transcriptase, RNA-dependent DNA polymerase [Tanacetum cinerariifolium]
MVVGDSSQPHVKDTTLTFQCLLLTPTNYTIWRMRVEVLLGIHRVWDVVDPGSNDAKKNNIVKGLLSQSILKDLILQIGNLKTRKEMWEALKTCNLGDDRVKEAGCQTLITEFENRKMSDNDSIDAYAVKFCGNLLIKVMRSANRLYKAQLKVRKPYCLQANIDEESWLWHVRLGHIGFGAVNLMDKLAKGVPVIKNQDQVCESCMVGKQTKKSFSKKATYRALKILEMVHGDICGPITPSTQAGNSYNLVLIDDCSRYMWSFLLKHKSDAFGVINRSKTSIEKQMGKEIITLHTDRGGVTPYEKFYGEKPNLEDLKVFGCVAYERIVSKHLKKLDDRSKQLVYLGKEPSSGGFWLYNPHENKIIISAYVVFDEKKAEKVWNNDATVHATVDDATVHATTNTIHNPVTVHETPFHVTSPKGDEDEYESDVTPISIRRSTRNKVLPTRIYFDEVFTPVACLETIRLLIALAAGKGWKIHHLDVKTTFLHGELKEEVYVTQHKGFEKPGEEKKVYKLAKSLYGLRQAPMVWNIKLDNTLKEMAFKQCMQENVIYKAVTNGEFIIVAVYVDDLFVNGTSLDCINEFKRRMASHFEMSDLGELIYYLGIEVSQGKDCVEIKKERYARKILKEAGMEDCNATLYPMDEDLKLSKDENQPKVKATH